MDSNKLKDNLMKMFPSEKNENMDAYMFWIDNAMGYLIGSVNKEKAWEKIKLYDGNTKRPKLSFFKLISGQAYEETKGMQEYYTCQRCGAKLSLSSEGGCPVCHSLKTARHQTFKRIDVIKCQSGCYDCSEYHENVLCASCSDFGTPKYESCEVRRGGGCVGSSCCKYEYMRTYHPVELRKIHDQAIKALPRPLSEAGKAFQDGRASINDITAFLKSRSGK